MLVDAAREGKKSGNKWQSSVWTSLIATLSKKTNEVVQSSHIENRMRQMKIEYRNFMELKEKSGVAYDSVKQTVDMSDDYWNDLLKLPKGKEKFKAFRDRGIKWDLEKLAIIIGNSQATGSCSLNGLDDEKADVQEGKDKGQLVIELDEEESISCTSTKKRQVPSLKRQHGKKEFVSKMMDDISIKMSIVLISL
ncbi:hypothetical protein FRX31_019635 [Thalictrum thalictroides]|uniref:Myb/SANT-like domain-containing protein n=1 Tax=Thalictrum thalictroides TaxID=46969 RepID=A0A7J6W2L3_THATH|nr:hypothetical protein FRX31_019635 [Thalictrum thalictroides]